MSESLRVVMVTGSSGGIGLAIAQAFAREGYAVVLNGRNSERLRVAKDVLQFARAPVLDVVADVRDWDQVQYLAQRVEEAFGRLDVLVNNAGGSYPCRLEEMTPEIWRGMIESNLSSAFYCCRVMFPLLKQSRGSIINIASVAGLGPHPGRAHYATAKAGLINLTRCIAQEWGRYGIRANAVAPGAIWTENSRWRIPELRAELEACTPLGRVGRPDEVANLCVFLASGLADYITGAVIRIDGGPRPVIDRPDAEAGRGLPLGDRT